MERILNESPVNPTPNHHYVRQQLRQRLETYQRRHKTCETQYDRHRFQVIERDREEVRRLHRLIGEVAMRKNPQRQTRNGVKMPVVDHQALQGTADDFQVQGRRAASPALSPFVQRSGGWKSQTLPGRLTSQPSTSQRPSNVTWGSYNIADSCNQQAFARSMSFPGNYDAARDCDDGSGGHLLPPGQLNVMQQVKSESSNALPSCVFSRAQGSKADVPTSGDDLQSFIMQALENYPSTNQPSQLTNEQTAFDLLEEVMREPQPEMITETPSMRINQDLRGSDAVALQQTKSLPSSPQQVRHSMFEERGRLAVASNTSHVGSESSVHYYTQQVDARHNQPVSYRQPVSTVPVRQQSIINASAASAQSSGFMLPFGHPQQTQMQGQNVQGQHVQVQHQGQVLMQRQQPTWQLHQEIVQKSAPRELEKHQQQLQRSAPGATTPALANRVVVQPQQPHIAIQPPPSAATFSHMASNNGMMQMSDQSIQSRNHQFKAPRSSFSGWSQSLPSSDMFGPESRNRSNSYHGQSSKLSVPYPTRPLTPPLRTQPGTVANDVSSSLASTMPFSHFLPPGTTQSLVTSTLSNRASTGSISNIVNSLLDRDGSQPVDFFSGTSLQNDSELEFDRILRDPPSGFDLLSEISNCVDDSTMDIGTTA